jgi:diaminohydroxyphosphoribosylaminopyrimidine deaminase / 5-amino-6-(5-phosphoribosylamino)uracil reductase
MPEHFMEYALRQAERSVGLASPNPAVGCVLVKDGRIVGEGFHEYDKRDHAEIVALRQVGNAARGAIAYVTLEPCCHHGRTGPCADALLAAGVAEVVVATTDPNPLVRGEGIARLRAGGVRVQVGVMEEAARRLNDGFARHITSGLPFVTMKVASSLDGRIGPGWLTSEPAAQEVHRLRHACDAIMVGVGTILADDPLLTDRSGLPRRRPLLRVVLDSQLRTPIESRLVSTAQQDVLIFYREAGSATVAALEARGVRLQQMESLPDVVAQLGKLQLTSVLLEGGQRLFTSALEKGLVDRLVLFYAPRFLGEAGVAMLGDYQLRLENYALRQVGPDFALDALFHDYWSTCLPA